MNDRILKFADSKQYLGKIARSGENNTRSMAFDCSTVLAEYPAAQIIAVIQRPQGDPYTVTPDADGTIRRITMTSYDLEFNGHMQIELRVIDDEKILKSAIYTATVDDSIRGETDAPGQPVRDVLDRLDAEIKKAQAVVDDIRQKLENGEFNGSDAEVTAENIQSALGFTPVKDVQVAGSSVLVNGVANVPYASTTQHGVVRVGSGVGTSENGDLYIVDANESVISRRITNNAITPNYLDYAVKAAMCDGKGAAWTADEQKAARERMGVDKAYELIEEIATDGSAIIERTQEPDGTPYDFEKVIVVVTSPKQMGASVTVHVSFFTDNTSLSSYAIFPANKNYFYRSSYVGEIRNSILEYRSVEASIIYGSAQGGGSGDTSSLKQSATLRFASSNITRVQCFGLNSTVLPAGFLIQIYGVRA